MDPDLPPELAPTFRATVHGTVFGGRAARLARIHAGSPLLLVPDPPDEDEPSVWVHLPDGDPVGHLPPVIGAALARWMQRGGVAEAVALRVGGSDVPSWKRLLIEVRCRPGPRMRRP